LLEVKLKQIFRAMRQASREYQPPPISIGMVLSMIAIMTALVLFR
jgi:hypothetical protein